MIAAAGYDLMWRGVYGLTCRGLPIVLPKDSDFDLISNATGQPVEWISPPGYIR